MAKILVADDEPDLRNLTRYTLEVDGHQVLLARNGLEALETIRQERPDLVVLDVKMPRMDGFQVCEQMKEDPLLREIPVIFLTAKGQTQDVERGLSLGAAAYLLKPFSPEDLLETVRVVLNREDSKA